jgi:hypothetical protein
LDYSRPFFCRVGGGVFREAGGFGVEEEEHQKYSGVGLFGVSELNRVNYQ